MKIIIGAGKTKYDGWISTQQTELDLLNREDFERTTMIHKMNLWHDPFEKIKAKTKTIEMRLYDEKRRR